MPINIKIPDFQVKITAVVRKADGTISYPEPQPQGDPK